MRAITKISKAETSQELQMLLGQLKIENGSTRCGSEILKVRMKVTIVTVEM